jgi:tRNA-dihydrouridine synthase 3
MDSSDKPEAVLAQPLPGADIPLDSNGANSGDGEAKKRMRTSSPDAQTAEGPAKRQKGVAPIKAESVVLFVVSR